MTRYLLNAYQTGFGLVVCVLEAPILSNTVASQDAQLWPGSTRMAWKQRQTGEGTMHDARCTFELSPGVQTVVVCIQSVFKVSICFNHFSHFNLCNFCIFLQFQSVTSCFRLDD